MLPPGGTISYEEWRSQANGRAKTLDKAEFNAALSTILTYPGDWGGVTAVVPGVFTRPVEFKPGPKPDNF